VRVFLDANVLFSGAHSPRGRARGLFSLAKSRFCELVTSEHAITEARRNLVTKTLPAAKDLEDLLQHVTRVAEGGPALVSWAAGQGLPENDAPILAAAAASDTDLLITGDRRHFGHLYGRTVGRVRIVTLREALKVLSNS
jgi:predicted nucleic acid-binding protein